MQYTVLGDGKTPIIPKGTTDFTVSGVGDFKNDNFEFMNYSKFTPATFSLKAITFSQCLLCCIISLSDKQGKILNSNLFLLSYTIELKYVNCET